MELKEILLRLGIETSDREAVYDVMYKLEYDCDGETLLKEVAFKTDKELEEWFIGRLNALFIFKG